MTATPSRSADVLLSVLGTVRLTVCDELVPISSRSKSEHYLVCLAIERHHRLPRSVLLEELWPGSPHHRAGERLNSLTHQLNKTVVQRSRGTTLIEHESGFYRLNCDGGVDVDIDLFDRWRKRGVQMLQRGDAAGLAWCLQAIELYRGELCAGSGADILSERERLRAAYLNLLARVADYFVDAGEPRAALQHIQRLLRLDYCREDAHRQAMRCHMQLGQRAQALRQYRLCCESLEREFGASPEPQTVALFDLIRRDPAALAPDTSAS